MFSQLDHRHPKQESATGAHPLHLQSEQSLFTRKGCGDAKANTQYESRITYHASLRPRLLLLGIVVVQAAVELDVVEHGANKVSIDFVEEQPSLLS